jgi:hypothetical protein
MRLQNVDRGAAKVTAPAAAPVDAFDMTFEADAEKPYRLWGRGRAWGDSYSNDSVYVQFDGAVDANGQPASRIGTTAGVPVIIEDCANCGLHGWGWADNGYGTPGTPIYFSRTGAQRLRVQIREDGIALDQIVLSAVRFKTAAPGTTKDDATILPASGGAPSPPPAGVDEVVLYAGDAVNVGGNWVATADATAAAGIRLQSLDLGAPKVGVPAAAPLSSFELTFKADAGKAYRLWVRGRATADSFSNDSLYVQFDASVDQNGQPANRIGSTSAMPVIVEDCSGCGLLGWGWADNGYGTVGPPVYFSTSGTQRMRVQIREDGVGVDQFVLSAVRYRTAPPGATKNDTTIVPK